MAELYSGELTAAKDAVILASQVCRAVQATISAEALEKKDRSPVTIADYASQAVICKQLREAFPNDPIVAEEDAADLRNSENAAFLERATEEIRKIGVEASADDVLTWIDYGNHDGTGNRYWTLDPIDGTKGFLRKEQFAVSLALIENGTIKVAALACPNLATADGSGAGVVFLAVKDRGATMFPLDTPDATPVPVQVSKTSDSSQARMCESVESGHSAHDQSAIALEKLGITAEPVRLDSQAKYGVVARGEADIYLRLPTRKDYVEKIWDHAGGVLVMEEAGGKASDIDGKPLDFSVGATLKNNRGVVVTNGLLHDQVIEVIKTLDFS